MNLEKFIGYKLEDIKSELEAENIKYDVIEVWDTKKTKMGDDIRIVNVRENGTVHLYVAYF